MTFKVGKRKIKRQAARLRIHSAPLIRIHTYLFIICFFMASNREKGEPAVAVDGARALREPNQRSQNSNDTSIN